MAHANIYEVSLSPIPAEEHMDEETIFCTNGWFIGQIADYIHDENRDHALQTLALVAKGFQIHEDAHGKYLLVTKKEDFFRSAWEYFCKKMESSISLEKFISLRGEDEKFGDYIYADGEMMTFASFIRGCVENEPYYVGGVLGYHQ